MTIKQLLLKLTNPGLYTNKCMQPKDSCAPSGNNTCSLQCRLVNSK